MRGYRRFRLLVALCGGSLLFGCPQEPAQHGGAPHESASGPVPLPVPVPLPLASAPSPAPSASNPIAEGPPSSCRALGSTPIAADGSLRCAELPIEIAFPPGTTLKRTDDGFTTSFQAVLERGALALVVEPTLRAADARDLRARLDALVIGIAADAASRVVDAPVLAGATASLGVSFTTPDGGLGAAFGYLLPQWMIALVAGGRAATTSARPDQPAGQAFIASLRARTPAHGTLPFELGRGVSLDISAAAWPIGGAPEGEHVFALPEERALLDLRAFERGDDCEKLAAARPEDLSALAGMVVHDISNVRAKRVPLGEVAIQYEGEAPSESGSSPTIVGDLVCLPQSIAVVSLASRREPAEIRLLTDAIAATLRAR